MISDTVFTARSKFKRKIHLTKATWFEKILKDHPELGIKEEYVNEVKKAVGDPDYIVSGWFGEYLALRFCRVAPKCPKYLCVVYRELNKEGFVIKHFLYRSPIGYLEGVCFGESRANTRHKG
jgi:hypothetical protein